MSKKEDKITCVKGKHRGALAINNFYVAGQNTVFSGLGRIPICKTCLYTMVENYYKTRKDMRVAIYLMCRKIDVAFDENVFEGALTEIGLTPTKVFMNYMTQYNSLGFKNGAMLPFDDGEHLNENGASNEEPEEPYIEDVPTTIKLTKEDRRNKKEVISLLEYDPFEGFSETDQKFLYSDLINYFGDEDVIEDQFLVSQIIQIVNNNNQIRKLDFLLSQYMANDDDLQKNDGKIKSLNSTKKTIVFNTDKIAKENQISVKNRRGSNINKSSLTVMMERLRLLDFKDAEIDYYDQMKSLGMQRAADISMKAMCEQMQFDENDINEIIMEQRNMIKDMEHKILDLEEENRLLNVTVSQLKGGK